MTEPKEQETVDSTSNERVVNNVMRHEYRVLTEQEKAYMQDLKDRGLGFVLLLHAIGKTVPNSDVYGSRELSIAARKIEEAVMWAVKHITK